MWKNSRKETELIKSCMINQILKKIIEQQKSAHSRLISLYFSKCAGRGRTVTGETLYIIKKSNKSTKWALFNPSPLLGNPGSSFLNWVVSVTFQNKVAEVSEAKRVIKASLYGSEELYEDLKASTGQARYVISPAGSGFTPRTLPSWAFVKNL